MEGRKMGIFEFALGAPLVLCKAVNGLFISDSY